MVESKNEKDETNPEEKGGKATKHHPSILSDSDADLHQMS